jgi:hypothetical protein
VPIFTQNLREAFRTVSIGKKFWLKLYHRWKLPLVPIYGGFPVKLKTIVGKPIEFDQSITPEELRTIVSAQFYSNMQYLTMSCSTDIFLYNFNKYT